MFFKESSAMKENQIQEVVCTEQQWKTFSHLKAALNFIIIC